ncbi:MAG: tRNA 2-thiouridine(34) synthase MnmA [Synergistales bacterium]|nr:tRNA 2-thiouridine(34) synthase MnmA [Synergistales bacterium]HHV52688.1 tRNA 2-thiouridine(34) synthase MnmA [Synergistaceae bacterium]
MIALVGMSGGVDSSTAALLLKEAGWEVIGLHLIISPWQEEARRRLEYVADMLKVPVLEIDASGLFDELVVEPFLDAYRKGFTPNPCVLCNERLKFAILTSQAEKLGAKYVATGHYASIMEKDGDLFLARAKDRSKDQSYVLYRLPRSWLSGIIFPLSSWDKEMVRRKAGEAFGDVFGGVRESRDICFIQEKLPHFLSRRLGCEKGPIVTKDGTKLGEHRGLFCYTVGQRKGLNLSGGPWYVKQLDLDRNAVVVGRKEDLTVRRIACRDSRWHEEPKGERIYLAQHRYRASPVEAMVQREGSGFSAEAAKGFFMAVAPGQSLVVYDQTRVIGGGIIERSERGGVNI